MSGRELLRERDERKERMGRMRPEMVEVPGRDAGGLYDIGGREELVEARRGILSFSSEKRTALGSMSSCWPQAHSFVADPGEGASLPCREVSGDGAAIESLEELPRRVRGRVRGV